MTWLGISIAAQIILGTSAVFDKLLLRRRFFDPWVYTFWAGVLGLLGVFLIPFGFTTLPLEFILLAFFTGGVFITALLFFFLALSRGEASVALPVIGGLAPIFTFLASALLLDEQLAGGELFGFLV